MFYVCNKTEKVEKCPILFYRRQWSTLLLVKAANFFVSWYIVRRLTNNRSWTCMHCKFGSLAWLAFGSGRERKKSQSTKEMCSVSVSACISLSDFNTLSDKSRAEFLLEFLQNKTKPCTELFCLHFYSWGSDIIKPDQIMSPCGLFRVAGETLSEPWGVLHEKIILIFYFL